MTVAARRSLGRTQHALLQGPADVVLGSSPFPERPPSVTGTLTVRTEPANARIRVVTASGSAYRDGMPLAPGQYEVVVEAENHEPFRKHLSVDGSAAYRISLCRLETRTKRICHDRPVTRYLAENRESKRSIDVTASIDLEGFLKNRGVAQSDMHDVMERTMRIIAGSGPKREHIRDIMCAIAKKELSNRAREYAQDRRATKCRADGGSYVRGSDRGPVCSPCDDISTRECVARVSWSCSYAKSVKVPYSDTERVCSDKKQTERVCPRGGAEAVVMHLR